MQRVFRVLKYLAAIFLVLFILSVSYLVVFWEDAPAPLHNIFVESWPFRVGR